MTINRSPRSTLYLRRLTISAILLAMALVLKTAFSFYIPMFGENGMSIGISGIFSMLPSVLFGPVYGALTSGLSDLLGYILKPTGPYLPLMTLIMAFGGFLRGALWFALRGRDSKKVRLFVVVVSVLFLATGLLNTFFLAADGVDSAFYDGIEIEQIDTDSMHLVSKMLITRTKGTKNPGANLAPYITFVTSGLLTSAGLGLLIFLADLVISKKFSNELGEGQISQLLIAMVLSGLVVTTLNTVVLRETIYQSWKLLPFSVVWIPRVIEEVLGNTVKAYFVAFLLGLFERQHFLRGFLGDQLPNKRVGA